MKRIVFRVDSAREIGSGHLMRCLTLAHKLKNKAEVSFISREHPGNLIQHIHNQGFTAYSLPAGDPLTTDQSSWLGTSTDNDVQQTVQAIQSISQEQIDWLIVDHYAIDQQWGKHLEAIYKANHGDR